MKKVLIIDDEVSSLSLMKFFLSHGDFIVTVAQDGDEGVKKYDVGEFDLVITNILMPNKDGIETIKHIRKSGKKTPILAISGDGNKSAMNNLGIAEMAGATRSLAKPFEKNAFLRTVNDCVALNDSFEE